MKKFCGQAGFNSSLVISEASSFFRVKVYSAALPVIVLLGPLIAREYGDLATVTFRIDAFCNSELKFSGW